MERAYLTALRKKQNESQQDVADALGISRQYYCMIEAGDRQKRMDIMLISALSAHFSVPVAEIVAAERALDPGAEK